jgi:hypothetical protein
MSHQQFRHKNLEEWLSEKLASWGISSLTDVQEKALSAGRLPGRV